MPPPWTIIRVRLHRARFPIGHSRQFGASPCIRGSAPSSGWKRGRAGGSDPVRCPRHGRDERTCAAGRAEPVDPGASRGARTTCQSTLADMPSPQMRPALLIPWTTGPSMILAAPVHASIAALTQVGIGDSAHVASLANEISNGPVLLASLDRLKARGQQLRASQATTDQHRDHRVVPQLAHRRWHRRLEEP